MKRVAALVVVLMALLLGSCGGNGTPPGPDDDASPSPSGSPGATNAPSLAISAPPPNVTVLRGAHNVAVNVRNFELVEKIGEEPEEGEGHLIFYLDVEDVPIDPEKPATTGSDSSHVTHLPSYAWPDIEPGEHTIIVQLVNNDNTPLDPPVVRKITFTVSEQEYKPSEGTEEEGKRGD